MDLAALIVASLSALFTAARLRQRGRLRASPFDVEDLGLERHHVFVGEREVVFFFEGDSAAAAVDALTRSPDVLKAAVRWRSILGGRPRLAEERFGWTREPRSSG
jgi:hypothetical protein